jgi:hypothetical protein
MKSCLGVLLALLFLITVLGTIGGIWYLSTTTEFERKEATTP